MKQGIWEFDPPEPPDPDVLTMHRFPFRSLEWRLVSVYVPTDDGADVQLMYRVEWHKE